MRELNNLYYVKYKQWKDEISLNILDLLELPKFLKNSSNFLNILNFLKTEKRSFKWTDIMKIKNWIFCENFGQSLI